ncbi:hypothetical protein B5G09_10260 [Alistipes sp. An54]|uniref:hypothetical protein n=1 Tax=Alistipes sp. An54 TaxID=1965645 RepID=UPI000B394F9D|nr:hypothetical protein [Alistipes sp. An54]OUN76458.1 hypothetical protein B5G09_10260 [Alistipes sp. An54]
MKPVEIEFLVKNNTRQGLSGVSGGIEGVEKDAAAAQKRIQALEAEIARLHKVMAATPKMDQTENIRQIEMLQRELQALQATAKKTDLTPVNAQTVQRTYNGLNMSIQQMARELPSLAMGPQMFFMAISNNLPIFTDELARARKEYDLLTASGQKATPVWKQVISSIGSFQTLLAVGITLAVVYGKEIGNFVSNLFQGKKAFDAAALSAEAFHATMAKGNVSAQEEITKLNLLYKAATDAARPYEERKRAVEKLQEVYPAYFGNMDAELIMAGNLKATYDKLRTSIVELARARAASQALTKMEGEEILVTGAPSYKPFVSAYKAYAEAMSKMNELREAYSRGPANDTAALEAARASEERFMEAADAMTEARKRLFDEIGSFEGGEDIIKRINEQFDGNLANYFRSNDELRLRLTEEASKSFTIDSPDDQNEAEKARRRAVEQALKDAQSREEELQTSLRKLRDEASQTEVDALQEGAEKECEQIRLDYEKKRQQYEDEERKMLALIKKLRASGADVDPGAEAQVMATSASALAAAAKLRDRQLEEVDKKEEATYEKLLQKYETYQQGRLHLAEKYDAEIAKLAADPRNQEVAQQAKQKALDEFDVKFASQFPQFEAWADFIVSKSIKDLEKLLVRVHNELDELQDSAYLDDETLGIARGKVATVEAQLEKMRAKESLSPDDKSIKKWQDLQEVLRDASNEFEQIGNQVGGTGGEILQLAGQISSSIITMIGGIQTMANAAAISISNVEKASVILTIIAAAVQVITAVVGLFSDQESSMERNLRLAREFNEELRIMKERSKIDSDAYDSIFGDRVYDRYKQNIEVVRTALDGLRETQEQIILRGEEVYHELSKGTTGLSGLDKVAKTWESAAQSVANMQVQVRHSTWFRSAKYQSLASISPELFDNGNLNMEALKQFVQDSSSMYGRLSEENRTLLQSLINDWETYEEAIAAVNDYLQGIFDDLGNTLTDALVDAFENGTDAADSFVESVGQAMRKLAKEMIYSNTVGQAFEDAQRRFDAINRENLSDEDRFARWSEAMQQMVSDALGQQDDFNKMWEEFRRIAAANGLSIDEAQQGTTQSGKAGTMNTVTQESFSRVEGLVTSIQIHAANMDDAVEEGIIPTLGRSLDELRKIATNTESLPLMYDMLVKFDREGIKVK